MINAGRSKARRRDPAGSLRASWSLLQEYSQKRQAAEIPAYRSTARGGRRGTQAIYSSAHAIDAGTIHNTRTRETYASVLPRERYHAVQRRDRELVVAQDVVIRMLRPHADARREI